METQLKEQFIGRIMRLKRVDICPLSARYLLPSELAVMARASNCDCIGKGMNVSDIQQALYMSKPAVSYTLNSLEKRGYIIRAIDPGDRRKITVSLTSPGEMILDDAKQCFDEELDAVLERFGVGNTKTLIELIDCLMGILNEA